jgi:hypothetical protein
MRFTFLRITESNVLRVLASGVCAGDDAARRGGAHRRAAEPAHSQSVAQLARDQLLIARLVHDVQMEENAMTEVLHQIAQLQPQQPDHAALAAGSG